MSHNVGFMQFALPDSDKKQKDSLLPSEEEIQEKYRAAFGGACSACGKTAEGAAAAEELKICSGCRLAEYCSQKCQLSHWPSHKPACRGAFTSDTDFKLIKKLVVNEYLMFELLTYASLALDLSTTPSNALDTCLLVNLTMRDADAMAALKALLNGQDRDPNPTQILQIASIEKRPLESVTTPAMRSVLETARRNVANAAAANPSLSRIPVVMFVFTSDGTNSLGFPFAMHPLAMKLAHERTPIRMQSGMMGEFTVPMEEKSILETLNNEIRMDKSNRFLLRSKSK